MNRISPKSFATIVVIVAAQIGFILSEQLAVSIGGSNIVLSTNIVLVLNIIKTVCLIGGLIWVAWLLKHKYNTLYTWRDTLPLIMAILLLESSYFAIRLLSFAR